MLPSWVQLQSNPDEIGLFSFFEDRVQDLRAPISLHVSRVQTRVPFFFSWKILRLSQTRHERIHTGGHIWKCEFQLETSHFVFLMSQPLQANSLYFSTMIRRGDNYGLWFFWVILPLDGQSRYERFFRPEAWGKQKTARDRSLRSN